MISLCLQMGHCTRSFSSQCCVQNMPRKLHMVIHFLGISIQCNGLHCRSVKSLLFYSLCFSSVSVCVQDGSCMTLTMLAAIGGQDDILRLLIKKGVRVNKRQKNGTTALMHAAEKVTLSFM